MNAQGMLWADCQGMAAAPRSCCMRLVIPTCGLTRTKTCHGSGRSCVLTCCPTPLSRTMVMSLGWPQWLPIYQERNTSGLCAPQGAIAAIRGGWPHKPAFSSAATEVYIDMRCNPRTPPAAVKAQFAEAIQAICAKHPELTLDWEMSAA